MATPSREGWPQEGSTPPRPRLTAILRSNRRQDWVNAALGVWLIISPWVLQFARRTATEPLPGGFNIVGARTTAYPPETWNAFTMGFIVVLLAVSGSSRRQVWDEGALHEWTMVVAAVWIFVAPWVLGFIYPAASWDHWIVGALIFAVCAWHISSLRHRHLPAKAVATDRDGGRPQRG